MTQNEALAILKTGANVFLTGEPGSGKTHTVNRYVTYLRSRGIEPAITASTGIASTHINGMTIHSWSGIGIRKTLTPYELDKIGQNSGIAKRIARAQVLVIDEISMLSANTFSMVDQVCREVRQSLKPFGGVQVVLVGDFFQLPPVSRQEEDGEGGVRLAFENSRANPSAQFAYHSPAWEAFNPLVCYLSEQHRQEDAVFLEILSAVRGGTVEEKHWLHLKSRYVEEKSVKDITKLFPHNTDVDRINEAELSKLSSEARAFKMEASGVEFRIEQLKRSCLSPENLTLKIGAKVMFTKNNIEKKFVNGTTGEVISFQKSDGLPIVETKNGRKIIAEPMDWAVETDGKILAKIVQVPLRLAWAITVHKSQGMSLDAAMIDLSRAFEYGQGYVALSRVRTLAGLHLLGINKRALEVHPDIFAKNAHFQRVSEEARRAFDEINPVELAKMHAAFVCVCGGNLTPTNQKTLQKSKRMDTYEMTKKLFLQKLSLEDIAKGRKMTVGTIVSHIEKLCAEKKIRPSRDLAHLLHNNEETIKEVLDALHALSTDRLKPVFDRLGGRVPYDTIRIVRLFFNEK